MKQPPSLQNPKQMLDLIWRLQAELSPKCFSNCTIDLLNTLQSVIILSNETLLDLEQRFKTLDHEGKANLWRLLQDRRSLTVTFNRVERTHLAILSCQLAVLLSHKAVCESMYKSEERQAIHKAEKSNLLQFPTKG